MSVADVTPRVSYNCNGSLESFSFTFPIIVSSDLQVILRNKATNVATVLTETTHYSVADSDGVTGSLADYENGGTITTTVVYSSTYEITLVRAVPYTQAAVFSEGMQTLYANFESALDKLTMQVQQLRDKLDRSPYCPADDPTTLDMEMPNATTRANKYAYYDANGEPTAVAVIDTGTLSLSVWAETLVDSDNAAEGRAVLELDNLTNDVQAKADFTGYGEKTTPADDDIVLVNDSEALNVVKQVSVANLRAKGIKVITSTRDMTAGSGDVAYTGVGFKPSLIIFQGAVDASQVAGWGVVDAASKHHVSYDNLGNYYQAGPGWAFIIIGGSMYQGATLKTFDADGFTLTWTKSGSPSGTIKFSATCFR